MRTPDLIGQKFGRLQVIAKDEDRKSSHDVYWLCKCDCGSDKSVTTGHLRSGTVKSCGCLHKQTSMENLIEASKKTLKHGEAGTNLYSVWNSMKQRCENPNSRVYRWYGGKGVKLYSGWKEYAEFARWAYSNGYSDIKGVSRGQRLSIDRIDSNGDYCPKNCRWITVHENCSRAAKKQSDHTDRSTRAESVV